MVILGSVLTIGFVTSRFLVLPKLEGLNFFQHGNGERYQELKEATHWLFASAMLFLAFFAIILDAVSNEYNTNALKLLDAFFIFMLSFGVLFFLSVVLFLIKYREERHSIEIKYLDYVTNEKMNSDKLFLVICGFGVIATILVIKFTDITFLRSVIENGA